MKKINQRKASHNAIIGLFAVSIVIFLAYSTVARSAPAKVSLANHSPQQAVVLTPDQAVAFALLQGEAAREIVMGPLTVQVKNVSGKVIDEYQIDLTPRGPAFLRISGD